ncbi:MAG: hypothetical protein HYT28_03785 [Parcubacteria group bacterium]|nr:hypothetical protein [Parcubacteria group bacterium]
MKTKEITTEYFIPPNSAQWRYLCGVLLPEIARTFETDIKTAHQRMRDKLMEWGYITESRRELDYFQVIEITERFKNYLAKRGICIE